MATTTHDVRTMCGRCGTWYWAGDAHTCTVPGPTNADVVAAAFPDHGLMAPRAADTLARLAGMEYRARIGKEDLFLELLGVPPVQEVAA